MHFFDITTTTEGAPRELPSRCSSSSFLIPIIAIGYVLTSLFLMKVFEKAGVQGKWRAWVPVSTP